MGFGRKTRVSVSSVVYNLAGNEDDRVDFLKSTILTGVIGDRDLPTNLNTTYLGGQGIRLRKFANWAETSGYNAVTGNIGGSIRGKSTVNIPLIVGQLPVTSGMTITVSQAEIDSADFSYWADQYISENDPGMLGTLYTTDMDAVNNLITITYPDTSTVVFSPVNFDYTSRYLYATYTEKSGAVYEPLVVGGTIVLAILDTFPSTIGWDENSNTTTPQIASLVTQTTIDVTYSDATPPTHTVSSVTNPVSYNEIHAVYEKSVPLPPPVNQDVIKAELNFMYFDTVGIVSTNTTTTVVNTDIGGGVTRTTTTTVVTDTINVERTYRIDTQVATYSNSSPIKIFIYREGSGNATLDSLFSSAANFGTYYPLIPFRLNNVSVPTVSPILYSKAKKAFTKAINGKYDKVLENINSNPQIGDIDFAYAVCGVSLNVKENACRRYIYQYFKLISQDPSISGFFDYDTWVAQWNAAHISQLAWIAWKENPYSDNNQIIISPPEPIPYPDMPRNQVSVTLGLNYRVAMGWNYIDEDTGVGLLKPDAKRGDCWLTIGSADEFQEVIWGQEENNSIYGLIQGRLINNDLIFINYQETDNTWSRLRIRGLNHKNYIYGAHFVNIGSAEALADTEESGFIIPLHENVFDSMGLIKKTQMGAACCFLVFNTYQTKRTRWYETGLFKIVLIVILVVVTVMTFFTTTPVTGPALAATLALGLTAGTFLYALVVFIVNAIIATIVIKILTRVATHFWGEKVGLIVGTIGSIITLQAIGTIGTLNSFSSIFGQLLSAPNLMMLMNSASGAYTAYIQSASAQLQGEVAAFQQDYTQKLEEITSKTKEMFGSNDLLSGSQVADILLNENEAPYVFLQRTLMVGSDIAEMSISMLNNFTEMTLSLDLVGE